LAKFLETIRKNIKKNDLESTLNSYTSKGWRFISITRDMSQGNTENTFVFNIKSFMIYILKEKMYQKLYKYFLTY